jgi:glycosidase
MQWDALAGAGFTSAPVQPWLPIGESSTRNVAAQRDEPNSTLTLCRNLIALRRTELGTAIATYQALPSTPGCRAYRVGDLVVQANFSDERPSAQAVDAVLLTSFGELSSAESLALEPWQGLIGKLSWPGTR